ncbi:481_t:CDS:10 [Ambispora leptoticha]|uniref:481_t:CDS:1 n=1 Tax=Ambispora leptoticha TaxID=144679 RepID=A0A9N8W5X2_9GLOM|nr:481_t:CDS:10 [Ambispora leptoticha]
MLQKLFRTKSVVKDVEDAKHTQALLKAEPWSSPAFNPSQIRVILCQDTGDKTKLTLFDSAYSLGPSSPEERTVGFSSSWSGVGFLSGGFLTSSSSSNQSPSVSSKTRAINIASNANTIHHPINSASISNQNSHHHSNHHTHHPHSNHNHHGDSNNFIEGKRRSFDSNSNANNKSSVRTLPPSLNRNNNMLVMQRKASHNIDLIGEMMFGAVPLSYKGMTTKIHYMKSPKPQILLTKLFSINTNDLEHYSPARQPYSESSDDESLRLPIYSSPPSIFHPGPPILGLRTSGISISSTTSSLSTSPRNTFTNRRIRRFSQTSMENGVFNPTPLPGSLSRTDSANLEAYITLYYVRCGSRDKLGRQRTPRGVSILTFRITGKQTTSTSTKKLNNVVGSKSSSETLCANTSGYQSITAAQNGDSQEKSEFSRKSISTINTSSSNVSPIENKTSAKTHINHNSSINSQAVDLCMDQFMDVPMPKSQVSATIPDSSSSLHTKQSSTNGNKSTKTTTTTAKPYSYRADELYVKSYGRSLMVGLCDSYMSDFVLMGLPRFDFQDLLETDLKDSVQQFSLPDEPVTRSFCILGNLNNLNCTVLGYEAYNHPNHHPNSTVPNQSSSSTRRVSIEGDQIRDGPMICHRPQMSNYVYTLLRECKNLFVKMNMPADSASIYICLDYLEDQLRILYLKSLMYKKLLLNIRTASKTPQIYQVPSTKDTQPIDLCSILGLHESDMALVDAISSTF